MVILTRIDKERFNHVRSAYWVYYNVPEPTWEFRETIKTVHVTDYSVFATSKKEAEDAAIKAGATSGEAVPIGGGLWQATYSIETVEKETIEVEKDPSEDGGKK